MVETLFYIAGLLVLLTVITITLFYMYNWYQTATLPLRVDSTGSTLIDRIVREVRSSEVVNSSDSVLSSNNGALSITKTANSVSTTTKFALSNGYVTMQLNGGTISNLSPNGMTVTKLYFKNPSTSISSAVRVDIDIAYKTKQGTTTRTFSGFSLLRQSYE